MILMDGPDLMQILDGRIIRLGKNKGVLIVDRFRHSVKNEELKVICNYSLLA